jgi:hypothetical protein
MFESTLSNMQLILTGLICVVLIVTAVVISGSRRREIVRLRDDVKQLSDRVATLEATEQRRFMAELKSKGSGTPTLAPTADVFEDDTQSRQKSLNRSSASSV